ncbi:hypothetical protein [Mucilaginibacter celer]|uniref:Uncharacterized protein n=1 Tax=Mucilaginibacter celer TaxID=2305508 RepID=A0A494VTL3_9SPHI|nr:hypothetical protein [Mucilaginibacter celer]AYL94738.1 hypothetical protein HYN43_005250 [Mucilaginibacter celer]
MRKLNLLLLFICLILKSYAQTEAAKFKQSWKKQILGTTDIKQQFANHDLSKLWTVTDNQSVYGFIGDNYQRIRIKFISIKKAGAFTYVVTGKTKVRDNICNFKGTFTIADLRKYQGTSYGVDNKYKNKLKNQYTILGDYTLTEDSTQKNTGVFKGIFKTDFYVDNNNKIHYDDIDIHADGFTNNEFVGSWAQYTTQKAKRCNWGDYRIPNSGDLDVGAGEFSANEKYIKNGWLETYNKSKPATSNKPPLEWWQ